jgi:glutaredoxin 3
MRGKSCLFILFLMVPLSWILVSSALSRELYQWVDKNGIVHVTDYPPEPSEAKDYKVRTFQESDNEPGKQAESKDRNASSGDLLRKDITIYTTPTCPWCIRAKAFLSRRGIRYREVDVTKDKKNLEEMIRVSGQTGVPVIVIEDEVMVGFDQERLEEKLRAGKERGQSP